MRHTMATYKKIQQYIDDGYEIIEGNNPMLFTRKKYQGYHVVRLAQTNSRIHGKSINTIWAIKEVGK